MLIHPGCVQLQRFVDYRRLAQPHPHKSLQLLGEVFGLRLALFFADLPYQVLLDEFVFLPQLVDLHLELLLPSLLFLFQNFELLLCALITVL